MHSDHFTIPDHTGCLITLSDRNGPSCPSLSDFDYMLDLLSADFDFKFRCTLILSVLGPITRPSMSLQPILTLYFDALGPFRTRTLSFHWSAFGNQQGSTYTETNRNGLIHHIGYLITRSDRNGPILILVATYFYHTGCLITLSDRNELPCRIATDLLVLVYLILTIFFTYFQPIWTFNFDAL